MAFAVLENACAQICLDYFTHEKSRIALCLGVLLGDGRALCAAWPASTAEIYPIGGNFTPVPPPIQCDDFYATNGVACIYVVNNATKLVTPLVIGNVSMPDKNPSFVVQPPKVITGGGWFSFHTLLDWANKTAPVDPWSGFVQYSSKDASGNTYIFQIVFNFAGGGVDIGFDFPQHHGLDVGPEVRPNNAY